MTGSRIKCYSVDYQELLSSQEKELAAVEGNGVSLSDIIVALR